MFIGTLLGLIKNEQQRKIIKIIETQLSFLLSLVNDLLDLKLLENNDKLQDNIMNFKP